MKSKKLLRIVSLVVALCMVFSLTAFAVPNNQKNSDDHAKEFVIKKGIVKGNGNGDYDWENYVKRGDLTLMIVRAFHLSMINKGNFEDVSNEQYYYEAIATAKAHGIAKGDGKNFNPKKYVTIGEAILLIERSAKVANSNVVVNSNVDLDDIYDADDQKEYATRQQIAHMLYLVFPVNGEVDDRDDEDEDEEIIEFTVEKGEDSVTFGADSIEDFEEVFDDMFEDDEDKELDYIKIALPLTSQGKLYYDVNKLVTSSTKLFLNDEDEILLKDVTFVPNENFSGTFYLKYEAFDQADDEDESDARLYKGVIKITVLRDEEIDENELETITYRINDNDYEVAEFDKADFNDDLDSVSFEIPAAAEGRLYVNYGTASQDKVANTDEFDYADLSDITFVPHKDFVGTTYIDYSAEDGDKDYTGKIKIVVKDTYDIELMTIEAANGSTITFDGDAFEEAFDDSTVYSTFEHVMFELVDSDYGTLKYEGTAIDYDEDFTESELDDVKLYLDDTNEDTFLINYTVHEDGKEFDGVIKVIIK